MAAFPTFNFSAPETLDDHLERFGFHLDAMGVDKEEMKRGMLISTLDDTTYRRLKEWLRPVQLSATSYTDIVAKLRERILPTVNRVALWNRFVRRTQQERETAAEFMADLERMADKLGFEGHTPLIVLLQVGRGMRDRELQNRVFAAAGDLTANAALRVVQTVEEVVRASVEDAPQQDMHCVDRPTSSRSGCFCCGKRDNMALACAVPGETLKCENWEGAREQLSGNTLYQLSFQDVDEGADLTVKDNFFQMAKEVEKLIKETNELQATKNALNVIKDDLIIKVDELKSEQERPRIDVKSLNSSKTWLQHRVQELEEEVKKAREEADRSAKVIKSDDVDVPMAQRKQFPCVRMARILMERNQYRERLMELQEAVRSTALVRSSRSDLDLDCKSKQSD